MDELKKILKGCLFILIILGGIIIGIPLVNNMLQNPLVECQKYVENWKNKELNNLNEKTNTAREYSKKHPEEIYFDANVNRLKGEMESSCNSPSTTAINFSCADAVKSFQNSGRPLSEEISIEYNQRIAEINANYNYKLKACSSKN